MKEFKVVYEDKRSKVLSTVYAKSQSKKQLEKEILSQMKEVYRHPLKLKSIEEFHKYEK